MLGRDEKVMCEVFGVGSVYGRTGAARANIYSGWQKLIVTPITAVRFGKVEPGKEV